MSSIKNSKTWNGCITDLSAPSRSNESLAHEPMDELVFNLCKSEKHDNVAEMEKLISILKSHGLREHDPRLQPMIRRYKKILMREGSINEIHECQSRKLTKEEFKSCVRESLDIITKSLTEELVIPSWTPFCKEIEKIYKTCSTITFGEVASYIPQLARLDPNAWGVSICTVDGQRMSWGDSKKPFCVQSVSNVFSYSIAASDLGGDFVHKYVGQEPSGRLRDAICLDRNGKPHNPMINSGALLVASMIEHEKENADRYDYVLKKFKQVSGHEFIGFNNSVYLSENETSDRNFALGYYMKENKCYPYDVTDLTQVLDFYYQLCSIEANCESLAVMAATLANGGVCPTTEEKCFDSRACRDVLTLMNSCGMYDYSGQFSFHIGLPAKSSASGVIMVVIPDLMGIVLWSPPLNDQKISERGISFCQRFNFHNYDSLVHAESHKIDPRKKHGDDEKNRIVSLLFAAKSGDLNSIRRMYMKGIDMELKDYDKRTALHLASCEGHVQIVDFLLNIAKVYPEPKDRWNRTPLDDALQYGYKNVIKILKKALNSEEEHAKYEKAKETALLTQLSEDVNEKMRQLHVI